MGGGESKPGKILIIVPVFNVPHVVVTENKWKDLQYVKNYQPQTKAVSHVRVLLYGPVGAGKSSFISSVTSVLRGRMANVALVGANNADQSITKHYKTHKIKKEVRGNFYPFVFNDIMGLEEKTGQGVSVEDIKLALKGHVKDGYKFNPVSSLTPEDPGYNSSPSPDDRVHVLVWVCSANTPNVTPAILQKMRDVREAASDMNIPQLVLVTKVDEACAETEKDLKNIYKSKHLKKKMSDISSALGVPLNCFFPVKNYSKEISLNDDVDSLILSALRVMIDFGDDFIETM
ncbi:interferon-induced protein 44-like [Mastacembelus armatus]|uniref:interferon-induced protein 44-like n=1 Tax=Mastacembelus armatus TaxID=205130 RepID=UPI000E460B94|nr:interferon-induced protein 44-like [Mastacembelus armatus]